ITETRPTMVAFNLATRRDLPPLPYVRMFRDRHHEGDYTKPGAVTQWVGDDSFKLTGDPLNQRLTDLTRWVTAIQERGGEVIWLRMITTGDVWTQEQALFPRAEYYDRLAAEVPGHFLHFADEPSLAGFECPDGRHLDYRTSPEFTRALAAVLKRRGWLRGHR